MNYSFQREKILEIVLTSHDHPTAEMIYNRVKKIIPNVSLGTVYRNLNFLVEHGDISRINMPGGDRFDKTLYQHYHIRCKSCNCVEDFYDLDIKNFNFSSTNYQIKSVNINLEGICKNCQENREGRF